VKSKPKFDTTDEKESKSGSIAQTKSKALKEEDTSEEESEDEDDEEWSPEHESITESENRIK